MGFGGRGSFIIRVDKDKHNHGEDKIPPTHTHTHSPGVLKSLIKQTICDPNNHSLFTLGEIGYMEQMSYHELWLPIVINGLTYSFLRSPYTFNYCMHHPPFDLPSILALLQIFSTHAQTT